MKPFAVILLLAGLASCSPQEPPLRLGILEWPPYEIVRLAERLDYFPGGNVEIVEFRSPVEAERAYVAGGLDIIALNLNGVLEIAARDADHRVIVVIDESVGADAVISREPLERVADIAGKRIGMQSGALGLHILNRLLDEAGLALGDVDIVNVDFPDHATAFARGDVDLMITYEPALSALLAGGGHEVYSSARIPGEIIDVFVARQSRIDRRPDDYLAFTHGWFAAVRTFLDDPSGCAALLAPRFRMRPDAFVAALEGVRLFSLADNRAALGPSNEIFLAGIGSFVRSARAFSAAAGGVDLDRLLTDAALPREVSAEPAAAGGGGC